MEGQAIEQLHLLLLAGVLFVEVIRPVKWFCRKLMTFSRKLADVMLDRFADRLAEKLADRDKHLS